MKLVFTTVSLVDFRNIYKIHIRIAKYFQKRIFEKFS